jgi:esterase/lipase
MDKDMNGISQRIETQLSRFEEKVEEAGVRIKRIEKHLNARIAQVRKLILIMKQSKDPMILTRIVDLLGDIERVSDKLTSVDITPSGHRETSLESMTDKEYDEMEALLI